LVGNSRNNSKLQSIKVADIDIALQMLNKYIDSEAIKPLLSCLETLKTETANEAYQEEVINAFNNLGVLQGAVSIIWFPMSHSAISAG
jgi:hypothetical protein